MIKNKAMRTAEEIIEKYDYLKDWDKSVLTHGERLEVIEAIREAQRELLVEVEELKQQLKKYKQDFDEVYKSSYGP
jgi:hypothetical protein